MRWRTMSTIAVSSRVYAAAQGWSRPYRVGPNQRLAGRDGNPGKDGKRVEYDLDHLRRWSLWFDLKIIILTIFRGLKIATLIEAGGG